MFFLKILFMNIKAYIASSFTDTFATHFWQSDKWEKAKNKSGNKTFHFAHNSASTLVVQRDPHFLKFWKKSYWEIPRGPIGRMEDIPVLLEQIFEQAKKNNIHWVRVYPPFGNDVFWKHFPSSFWDKKNIKTAHEIFPIHTLMLDLSLSAEEILAQMKPKGRYNIRLAEKKGVVIVQEKNIKNFWKLMKETAKRDGFASCKKHTYQDMLDAFGDDSILLTAFSSDGIVLASKIFTVANGMAVYYYGASSSSHRHFMAPYLLQWKAMQWAKEKGASVYDFLGISPENDEHHKLSSVADFKLKFGGTRIVCDRGIDFFIQ